MGFFSSRKAEDSDSYQVTVGGPPPDRSMVQVIRSRFYGKKGKEREDQPVTYTSNTTTSAQILSNPIPPTPSASSQHVGPAAGPSSPAPRKSTNNYPLPPTPTSTKSRPDKCPPPTPSRTSIANEETTSKSSAPRRNTDTVTATLAQRLNELAVANSEGLLNDDEYRILRQSLFERFSSNAAVPTEASVVPAMSPARPRPTKDGSRSERPQSRVISNFQVERPLSINSKVSVGSDVANLFRRATGRRSTSKDTSDTSSVWSATSSTSNIFRLPRILSKKSSSSSVRTTTSQAQADTMSISSRRVGSERGQGDTTVTLSSSNRSVVGSVRRLATPPSSFPTRAIGQDARRTNSIYNVFDEENLTTVQQISQEISNVEAEVRRLMDAFNGLEVTTLAKTQRHHTRPSLKSADFGRTGPESAWGDSDGRSQRRINLADDAISMRSATSAGTTPSVTASLARSGYSAKKTSRSKGAATIGASSSLNPMNSRPGSLQRKNSSSSVTSADRRTNNISSKMSMAPPVPALPNSIYLKGNASNISLVRSANHLPMNTVPEDEKASDFGTMSTVRMDTDEVENEMDDIRRRREDVQQRYDARLEYLRAKLKGAQLHERLARK